ncbi:MAG: tetratricopeptide repeat protein, partial [Gammaproteobacteria bacterium]|nr:tetratricopeptide repeat protein [Gammaproteobacteria bacterium]
LQDQIEFPGSLKQFIELLVPLLVDYGQLKDGRNALETVLEAAEDYIGPDRREYCDTLLQELRAISSLEEQRDTPVTKGYPIPNHPIPPQKPPRAEHFTGREAEVAQLLKDLQPGRVITLCGPGGIGKTALAAEVVHRLEADRFPDGSIFYSFYGRPDINLAFHHIVVSFGIDPKPPLENAALRLLAGKRALLILDGTEEASNLKAVLQVRGECGVLVTSRKKQDALDQPYKLSPLPIEKAVQLLCAWGGDCAGKDGATRQICEIVGGLPLAVRLVGRYLNETGETAAEYLEWLQEQPIEALDRGEHKKESANVLLERSLGQVSQQTQQATAVVGQLALAPFTVEAVAAALNQSAQQTRQALGELVSYGFLLRNEQRYEVSHPLIHTYASRRMNVEAERLRRLAAYYTGFAEEQSEQGMEGYTRLDAERAHLIKVMESCQAQEEWQAIIDLEQAVDDYLDLRGYWTEYQTALEMGKTAARNMNDRQNEAKFLNNLGLAYSDLGQVEHAIKYYEQALAIDREIDDRRGEGAALGNLGIAYSDLGQVEHAIEYYEQALAIDREIGDRQGEGADLGNLGNAYGDLGQVEHAIKYYEQALAIDREIGDRRGEGADLGNLGNAYSDLGQVEQAIAYYEQALAIRREIGDRRGEGADLGNLGIAYSDLGQVEHARQYFQQALTIFEEIRSPEAKKVREQLAELEATL